MPLISIPFHLSQKFVARRAKTGYSNFYIQLKKKLPNKSLSWLVLPLWLLTTIRTKTSTKQNTLWLLLMIVEQWCCLQNESHLMIISLIICDIWHWLNDRATDWWLKKRTTKKWSLIPISPIKLEMSKEATL